MEQNSRTDWRIGGFSKNFASMNFHIFQNGTGWNQNLINAFIVPE